MNTVQKNALLSVGTLIFAGIALAMSQSEGAPQDIPWLIVGGLGIVTLLFSILQRRRRTEPPSQPSAGKKKARKR